MKTEGVTKHSDARIIRLRLIAFIRLYQFLAYACAQLRSWSTLAICLAVSLLVAMLVWHLSHLLPDELVVAIGILLALQLASCILIRFIPTAFKLASPLEVAFELERHFEPLKGRVASGVELALKRVRTEGISERLMQAAIADSLSRLLSVRWHLPLLNRLRMAMKEIALATMLWCGVLLWMALSHINLHALIMPFVTAYESATFSRLGKLIIEPLPDVVLRGSSIAVSVRAIGGMPKEVHLRAVGVITKRATTLKMHIKAHPMHSLQPASLIWRNRHRSALTYEANLHNLQEDTLIVAQSGNVKSREHLIRVVDLPTVKSISILIEPPPYTGLEVRELSPSATANLSVPFGAFVRITAQCNNRLRSAALHLGDNSSISMDVHEDAASVSFEARHSTRMSMTLQDVYGFKAQWGKMSLTVMGDKPPTVEVLAPAESEVRILPIAVVPIVVRAIDDYGLNKLKVTFVGNMPDKREVELGSYGGAEREATGNLLMHIVGLRVGSIIRFRALAYDNDELLGPKVGYSPWRTVRVVTLGEFLSEFEGLEKKAYEVLRNAISEYEFALRAIERAISALAHRSLSRGELSELQTAVDKLSRLKEDIERLSQEVSSKVDMAHLNQIASPIDWLEQLLQQFLLSKLSGDVDALKGVEAAAIRGASSEALSRSLEAARSNAAATMSSLARASKALQRARRFSELLKLALEAHDVSKSIYEAREQVEQLPRGKLLPRIGQVHQRMAAVEGRIQRVKQRMRAIASEWRDDGESELADILMSAHDKLPIDEIKSALASALEAMQQANLSEVTSSLSALHQAAQKLSSAVLEAYERARLHAYRSDRDKLAQLWRQVGKLLNEQREIALMTERALKAERKVTPTQQQGAQSDGNGAQPKQQEMPIPTRKELAERQEKLTESAQSLPQRVLELLQLVPQLDHGALNNAKNALRAMNSSSSLLRKGNLASANKFQMNAILELEALSSALSNVFHYEYGVASQLAGIAQMEMLDLALIQESINLRCEHGERLKLAHSEALRKLMAMQERMIRSALKRADNLFGAPWSAELRELVRTAQSDAAEVATAVEKGLVDSATRQRQERILLTLLRLANELSGTRQAMQMMQQRLASEREGMGMKTQGRKEGEEEEGGREGDWKDWLRSLPDSLFGKFIEHGPPMKSIPDALMLRQAQVTSGAFKGTVKGTTQPMARTQEAIAPAAYRNAITIYFKRVGSR